MQWCPACHAMLPDGLETCPRCGKSLGKTPAAADDYTWKDILQISGVMIGLGLIPILIVIGISILCIYSAR